MELYDVPFDLQELNVIVRSKLDSYEIIFKSKFNEYLPISRDLKHTFVDQQKWKLFCMYKISEKLNINQVSVRKWNFFKNNYAKKANFDDIEKNKSDLKSTQKFQNKVIATCYVSRYLIYYKKLNFKQLVFD